MALPRGKRHGHWVGSAAERDAVTAADGLQQGDLFSVEGIMWHWNGVAWVVEGGGTSARYVSIADLGAVVGGDAGDNADAFQAAIDQCASSSVYSTVLIPGRTGVWNMGHEIQMKSGVRVLGEGPNSRISFVGAAGSFTHDGDIWAQGSAAQIEAINADVLEGRRTVTLASAPSAVAGDLLLLYDDTDSSWDAHSVHQRSGEFFEVERISVNNILTASAQMDTYLNGTPEAEVHKVTPVTMTFENVEIIGRGADNKAALWIDFGRDITFLNCKITNLGHCLWLSRCFHVQVMGGEISRVGDGGVPHDAAIVEHCQDVLFRDCNTNNNTSSGAGIRVGGADVEKTGAFPSRLVRVEGGNHASQVNPIVFSRHTDLCEIVGGVINGETLISGGRHTVRGTRFHVFHTDAIDATGDFHYCSLTVQDCDFTGSPNSTFSTALRFRVTSGDDLIRDENSIIFRDNKVSAIGATEPPIEIFLDGAVGPTRVAIDGNQVTCGSALYGIEVGSGVSYLGIVQEISISGNNMFDCGIWTYVDCQHVTIEGNKITDPDEYAINMSGPPARVASGHNTHIVSNAVYNCTKNVVRVVGFEVATTRVYIVGNSVQLFGSGTNEEKAPVHIDKCDSCTVQSNTFGGGNGGDLPACHMSSVNDLYWGGNSFPEIGSTSVILEPTAFTVTNFHGETWSHTESLLGFTQNDRHIAWGTDIVSTEAAVKLAKIQHSHDVWLMEIRVVADTTWTNLNVKIYFDNDVSEQVSSGVTATTTAGDWFIYRPFLFVPRGTDVRVSFERDSQSGDGLATVTWLNVGYAGGPPPAP